MSSSQDTKQMGKTQMSSKKEWLYHAQTLAEFSHLEPQGVKEFCNRHPGFCPDWWDTPAQKLMADGLPTQWQFNQRWLRQAWGNRFADVFDLMNVMNSVFGRSAFWRSDDDNPGFEAVLTEHYPYHEAVAFLYSLSERWRMKFCVACGKRFVAGGTKQMYCGEGCAQERHKQAKLASYHRHKDPSLPTRWRKSNKKK